MAEANTGDPQPGAEQRIAKERDEARAQVAELQAQVKAQGIQSHAQAWLYERGVTGDAAGQWLQAMTPSFANMQFEETGEIAGLLDAQFGQIVPSTPATAPSSDAPPQQAPPQATPPQAEAPVPGIANPTPGGGGAVVHEPEKILPGSPEYRDLKANPAAFRQAAADGRIAWTPTDGRFPTASNTKLE